MWGTGKLKLPSKQSGIDGTGGLPITCTCSLTCHSERATFAAPHEKTFRSLRRKAMGPELRETRRDMIDIINLNNFAVYTELSSTFTETINKKFPPLCNKVYASEATTSHTEA